jgi:hypothetical protein
VRVVDERRVRRLLQRVSEDLDHLKARAGDDRAALRTDADRQSFVAAVAGWIG